MSFFKKNKQSKGIALVFAIIISVILFSIAAGVLNISMRELNFSTSAKDSDNSFYAADSGIECVLFNDKIGSVSFSESSPGVIDCFGETIVVNGSYPVFDFTVNYLGPNNKSCAKVTVAKDTITYGTKVVSKGYNLGGDNDCYQTGLNSTERVIEVNY
ncbi:MAG TPA: pilus assembly PilX N-terminal domain-containing protein [Candidatus Paceibacterota bacterium]|nr:pilus assembly PilX N-terminal domain-containing protein [Candidatus Paceibacterota bacterium]HPT18226.1 pilus assembly PilX N-terminal domain-containing protein [Candidatus Paceibacterota bacterium]